SDFGFPFLVFVTSVEQSTIYISITQVYPTDRKLNFCNQWSKVLHSTSTFNTIVRGTKRMPIIKSAKKRVKVARKATVRNVKTKRGLKAALKDFHASLTGGKKTAEAHAKAQSAIDKAGKHKVMHKNKVARKKRQL